MADSHNSQSDPTPGDIVDPFSADEISDIYATMTFYTRLRDGDRVALDGLSIADYLPQVRRALADAKQQKQQGSWTTGKQLADRLQNFSYERGSERGSALGAIAIVGSGMVQLRGASDSDVQMIDPDQTLFGRHIGLTYGPYRYPRDVLMNENIFTPHAGPLLVLADAAICAENDLGRTLTTAERGLVPIDFTDMTVYLVRDLPNRAE